MTPTASSMPVCSHDDGRFRYARVERAEDLPAPEPDTLDVAVLDMNHGWPNLGHNSLVHEVEKAARDLVAAQPGLRVRAISFEVRRKAMIPEPPGGRFALYLGTGGPGHLDPRRNDGASFESQGVHEDPAWEEPLFALFDAIRADDGRGDAALLAVCHTFGVVCRWARIARPVLRGPEKGGKSSGILENVLTAAGESHPWFGQLAEQLRPRGARHAGAGPLRLRITDTRLFDLLPEADLAARALPIGFETLGVGGAPGDALTMVELERDRGGVMPRMFAVNHHPEVVERAAQLAVLRRMQDAGEVTEEWAAERRRLMTAHVADEDSDRMLRLTADFTLLLPLRFHLFRQARRRAEALGIPVAVHEDDAVAALAGPA